MPAGVMGTGPRRVAATRLAPGPSSGRPRSAPRTPATETAEYRIPPRAGPRPEFLDALNAASRELHDPVAKLRYIREVLANYESIDERLSVVPGTPVRRWLYRWMSLEGLQRWVPAGTARGGRALSAGARRYLLFSRFAALVALVLLSGGLSTGVYTVLQVGPKALSFIEGIRGAPHPDPSAPAASPTPETRNASLAGPVVPKGIAPSAIWLVEHGEGWEQHSNGLRIETTHTVRGEPRRYRVFHAEQGMDPLVRDRPAGILYHTSESDVWPLDASFNENLRDSSHRLLRYLQRNRVYHYLIDRFGRVFRVVEEASKANHAGHSVWVDEDTVYLNLNHAFLGVSFETRWEGGLVLPITEAQFAAGRNLTDYLRQHWEIAPQMCVAHGLTSVNPRKHLIGHHLDWSRGFPFGAFGLPNQYDRPAPAVALFGFGYDESLLGVLGEPWPGVRAAERELEAEAAREGRLLDQLRDERQAQYDAWIEEQALEETTAKTSAGAGLGDRAASRSPGRGQSNPTARKHDPGTGTTQGVVRGAFSGSNQSGG